MSDIDKETMTFLETVAGICASHQKYITQLRESGHELKPEDLGLDTMGKAYLFLYQRFMIPKKE